MRLHRITLRDVKGVADRTVDLPDRGVVVLEGPNEVGKTTLVEAFDRLLDLRCTSASALARSLQPVGRDVGPFVEAELTVAGRRIRIAKRWLRSPLVELDVLGSAPEHLTGSAAQARLDQLLDGALDRTLWRALRLTQSGDGAVAPLVGSGALREALDAAVEAHTHDGDGERVLDAVEEEYRRYFTARAGRPTGDYRSAIEAHHRAQQEVAEAHRLLEEANLLLDRQQAARTELADADQRLVAARDEAREWFDFDAPHYEPVSVIQLEDEVVLLDGHTRVYLAFLAGAEEVLVHDVTAGNHPVVLYADCVEWCKRKGIISIADLDGRIVTHETYERRWIDRCRRVAAVLGN